MQTNPAVEQNKMLNGQKNPWNQSDRSICIVIAAAWSPPESWRNTM